MTSDSQRYFWAVWGYEAPVRVVERTAGSGIPVAPEGTLLVSFAEGQTLTALFGPTQAVGSTFLQPDRPIFQQTRVMPVLPDPWSYVPESADRFDNGARILGLERVDSAATAWAGTLYWQPTHGVPSSSYQFSVRLVSSDERTLGQRDFPSLERELWRVGDTVMSPVSIETSEAIPEDLRVQILMYTLPTIQNASVLDAQGNPVGQWLFLERVADAPE